MKLPSTVEAGLYFGSLVVGQFSAGLPMKGMNQSETIPDYIVKVKSSHYASDQHAADRERKKER